MHRKNRGTIMKTERYYVSENVTLTVVVSTGRLDIVVRRYYGNITKTDFWYATRDTKIKKWDLNYCVNGFCYNSAKLTERFASRADVIKYLSELAERIYNDGYEKMIVSELTTFETNCYDDKKNVPSDNELTETPVANELTDSMKTRGTKKHYYKMNSMGQWYELNKYNFMILWTSDIMFHVYLNEKCIGHGEICRSKIGFMYDSEEYNGFVKCDVENVTTVTKRNKVRTRMLEYYADEISESGNMAVVNGLVNEMTVTVTGTASETDSICV